MSVKIDRTYNSYGLRLVEHGHVRKRGSWCAQYDDWKSFKKILANQMKKPNPLIVPVHKFNFSKTSYNTISYTYDMSRCQALSQDEMTIISNFTDPYRRSYHGYAEQDALLSKKYPQLLAFLKKAEKTSYGDLHSGNVMKLNNKYVIIDLEGFMY